jgi:NAD(P)-dependent dehydrogenase (short-subunit alcohol dehydrogenase family)
MAKLQDQIALVTGSTSGIGRAIAECFAENSAHVIITGRRRELGETVVGQIQAAGGKASFFAADLAKDEDIHALVSYVTATFGRLDILVNNAGFIPRKSDGTALDGPIHLTDEAYWDQAWRVSLRSILLLCKLTIPLILQSRSGVIVHISSALALQGHGVDVYSAIKGALVSLTRSMAVSYAHRIRVNCICPGNVLVERNRPVWEGHPAMFEQAKQMSLTRVGQPRDIAECALFLASASGEFISGAILSIDGGQSIKGFPLPSP